MNKRFMPALVIALVLSGGAISQAQIVCTIPCPVWDFAAILQNAALNELTDTINDVLQLQNERIYKMAWRITQFLSLDRFVIHQDDRPEWRIFDYFSGAVLVANPYHFSLTYGDRTGAGFEDVSLPMPDPADALARLNPASADELRRQMALVELATSTIIRSTDEVGLHRYNGRRGQAVIDLLQYVITRDNNEESAASVADKISASALVGARDTNVRLQLQAAELELATLETTLARDAEAAHMNLLLTTMRIAQEEEGGTPSIAAEATAGIQNWRLP